MFSCMYIMSPEQARPSPDRPEKQHTGGVTFFLRTGTRQRHSTAAPKLPCSKARDSEQRIAMELTEMRFALFLISTVRVEAVATVVAAATTIVLEAEAFEAVEEVATLDLL